MADEKQELRKNYLRMRKALSKETVEKRSFKIIQKLSGLVGHDEKVILFYVPINNEVDILPLAKELSLMDKKILFPKLVNYERLKTCVIHDFFEDFSKGAFNIPEPTTEEYSGNIDLAFIPGVVFGKNGYRIGYGKGYYDRYLAEGQIKRAVGVCFDFQLISSVPYTDYDYHLVQIESENESIILP